MSRISIAVIGTAALVGLLTPMKAAQADPTTLIVNKCSSVQIKAAGKYGAALSGCYSKAAAKGLSLDPLCLSMEKMWATYAKTSSCLLLELPVDTAASVASDTKFFTSQLAVTIGYSGQSKCDAAKFKCVGKYLAGIAGCYAKAAAKLPGAMDGRCISKNEDKFSGGAKTCYEKAVARADCSNASTADAVRTLADTFLVATVCKLNPGANPDCS